MSYSFYPVKVKEVKRETADCVSVLFDIPETLTQKFVFQPGQYINIRHHHEGEEIRRSYSICSSPDENEIRIAVKKVDKGIFSTFANEQLHAGDTLEISAPGGNFLLNPDTSGDKLYVFFAAGSGITPILSQIKYLLTNEKDSSVLLFYGNRNFESVIFREELEALKNLHLDRFALYYVFSKEKLGTPMLYGRLNADKCMSFSKVFFDPQEVENFMICGPAEMIFEIRDTLVGMGVGEKKIHFELFSTEGLKKVKKDSSVVEDNFNPEESALVTIKLDDDVFEFPLKYGAENILDAALKNGADLPFACKGGVCSTCKARLTEGTVDMELNYALEPDELAAGFILTCQSHPRSPKIFVDFDQK
ncbi:MAG: 2Fe-2S iron-sulfur cluster binding domain-containing protein [Saprospiraceae bacterium]|nr:2Fe-2S iron-sulfur cluster binding domain-containing protein [Saprospiraceae bacterium]